MEACMTAEVGETSASFTADYSNCPAADTFGPACEALTGSPVVLPDIYIKCTYSKDEQIMYTSVTDMDGMGVCLGSSCMADADEEEMEQDIEDETNKILEKEGVMGGNLECEVTIGDTTKFARSAFMLPQQVA